MSDEELTEWDLTRSPLPPTSKNPAAPKAYDGILCYFRIMKVTSKVTRLLYGQTRRREDSAKSLNDAVCELDSSLNECACILHLPPCYIRLIWAPLKIGLADIPSHLRWSPSTQDPRWFRQTAMICGFHFFLYRPPFSRVN